MANIKKKTEKQIQDAATRASIYAGSNKAEEKIIAAAIALSRGPSKSKLDKLVRTVSNPTKAEYKAATAMQKQRFAETGRAATRTMKTKGK